MERDNIPEMFSSTADEDSIFTPPTSKLDDHSCPPSIASDDTWDGHCSAAVPWPGNTYIIIEKDNGRPVNRNRDGGVSLGKVEDTSKAPTQSQWLCVEKNNHIGFQNPQSGCYFGHNGRNCATASALIMKEWEYVIARPHPKGGYQLLSQHWQHTLKLYIISKDGNGLV